MPSQSLYRKWRSRTFAELIGQDHIRETLSNALRSGRVSHAYLFCGPRGTGKTSTARLLAKTVNCQNPVDAEPCNHCDSCVAIQDGRAMDLIEIDAASNRGIDEIRDLRDKVGFSPTQAKFKFYILDEVHMLTTEAFNALLKTLEEPPPHAVFVLVTTEPHKIPATITSRCQRFDFRRIGLKDLLSKLERVCREEGLDIDPAALELVARSATGSFRDAESLLDQLAAYGTAHVTVEYVQKLLGLIPAQSIAELVGALLKRDIAAGLRLINEVADEGHDLRQFNREIVEYLHRLLLIKAGNAPLLNLPEDALALSMEHAKVVELPELTRILRAFSQADQALRNSAQPQLPVELAFLDGCTEPAATVTHARAPIEASGQSTDPAVASRREAAARTPSPQPLRRPAPVVSVADSACDPVVAVNMPAPAASNVAGSPADGIESAEATQSFHMESGSLTVADVQREWPRVAAGVGALSRSIEGFLRACEPVAIENGRVVLGFSFAFHKDRIEEAKNRVVVEKVLGKVLERDVRIQCILLDKPQGAQVRATAGAQGRRLAVEEDPTLRVTREVFPGAQFAPVK